MIKEKYSIFNVRKLNLDHVLSHKKPDRIRIGTRGSIVKEKNEELLDISKGT